MKNINENRDFIIANHYELLRNEYKELYNIPTLDFHTNSIDNMDEEMKERMFNDKFWDKKLDDLYMRYLISRHFELDVINGKVVKRDNK